MKATREEILRWYKGKAREKAEVALGLLLESEQAGEWLPKASRSVRAALSKANVAQRLVEGLKRDLTSIERVRTSGDYGHGEGWLIYHSVYYCKTGFFAKLKPEDWQRIEALATEPEQKAVLEAVRPYVETFREVGALMERLDATRPKPVFTAIGVSPTVTKTILETGLDLDLKTIRVCPMEFFRVEVVGTDKHGQETRHWETRIRLLWPVGTRHNRSRFANGGGFSKCHACGHSIRNPFNWVPLLIDDKDGVPHALWVGRDCSESLFGIKVSVGDLKYTGDNLPVAQS